MTATVRQFALQKILTDTSSLQSPITLMTQILNPPRGIFGFQSFCPLSMLLLLPLCFFFLVHLMSQTCFLFMTVDDWGALLLCQPCSRGEHSGTWTNKNCHLLRGVQQTSGDEYECMCVCFCVCVCAHSSPWGKTSYLGGGGEKNRPICRCKYVPKVRTDVRPSDLPAMTGP